MDDAPLDTSTEIETPEHIRFRYQLAGPARRGVAYLIDLVIRGAVFGVLALLLYFTAHGLDFEEATTGVLLIVLFLTEWFYYVLFESLWDGRSPGKRMCGLRVIKEGGYPATFADIVVRNLVRGADFLPFGYALGLLVMSADHRFRRLGDLAAGTMVVVEEHAALTEPLRIKPAPTPAELATLPARVILRAGELEAIELFLRRQGALHPEREEELAELLAPTQAQRLGVRYQHAGRFLALLFHLATQRGS
ncbi:MAG: RDD family protein [Nannocystaceae bacterium]